MSHVKLIKRAYVWVSCGLLFLTIVIVLIYFNLLREKRISDYNRETAVLVQSMGGSCSLNTDKVGNYKIWPITLQSVEDSDGVIALRNFNLLPELQILHVSGYSHSETLLKNVASSKIRLIDIHAKGMNLSERSLSSIATFRSLSRLFLGGSTFANSDLYLLDRLKSLGVLDLSRTAVTYDALSQLSILSSLGELDLSNTAFTFDQVKQLSTRYPQLVIYFDNTRFEGQMLRNQN